MDLCFDLSGLSVRLLGLDDALAERFDERWGEYEVRGGGPRPDLEVDVSGLGDAFDDVPFGDGWTRALMPDGGIRFAMHEGEIEVDPDGKARARIPINMLAS